jgi:hypothetical protein
MPEIIFVMFAGFTWQVLRFSIRKMRTRKSQSVCADCFYAHVQYTTNGRRAISCSYGGALRPVKLDVLYCTDYRERNAPSRGGVVGFVYEIAPAD